PLPRCRQAVARRVEISLPLQSFTQVFPALFQQVRINSTLLVNRQKPLQVSPGKFRSGYFHLHSRSFRHVQSQRHAVFCHVILSPPHRCPPAEMPSLCEKFSDVCRSFLDSRVRYRASRLQFQPRKDLRIRILRAVRQLHGGNVRPCPRRDTHNYVNLVIFFIDLRSGGNLCLIQAFFAQDVLQPNDRRIQFFFAVNVAQLNLHRCRGGRLARRLYQPAQNHLIEIEILFHSKIELYSPLHRSRHGSQIRIISVFVESSQTRCYLSAIQWLSCFDGQTLRRVNQDSAVFPHYPNAYDNRLNGILLLLDARCPRGNTLCLLPRV